MKKLLIAILFIPLIAFIGMFGWRSISSLNDGMNDPRSEIHAALLDDKIYVAGGIGLFRVLDSCEYFNLRTRNWKKCPDLPRPLHHVAMASDQARIYASGGYIELPFEQDPDGTLFVLDPDSEEWEILAKLPHPIGQHAMFYRDGSVYLIGGKKGSVDLDSFWRFDLQNNEWLQMPAMPTARHSHAIALDDQRLFVTGGRSAELGTEIAKIEMFDFSNNSWSSLPDMQTGRAGHGTAIAGDNLHIFAGESLKDGKVLNNHEVLELKSMKWSKAKPLDQPRHGIAVAQKEGSLDIYVIGGGAEPGWHTIYSVSSTIQELDLSVSRP